MRTIIQHIGPLYGELNTGSVFGQPNGSIAVSQNLVPTPEPPSSDESVIWTISEYSFDHFTIESSYTTWSIVSANSISTTDSKLCRISLLSDITDTNTTVKIQFSTDESFSSVDWEGTISYSTSDSYVAPKFKSSVTKPSFTNKTVYYIRLLLYSSAGTYLSKKSNTLSLIYRNP